MAKEEDNKPTAAEKGKAKAPAVNGDDAVNGAPKDSKSKDGKTGKDGKDDDKLQQG